MRRTFLTGPSDFRLVFVFAALVLLSCSSAAAAGAVFPNAVVAEGNGRTIAVVDLNGDRLPDILTLRDNASLSGQLLVSIAEEGRQFKAPAEYVVGRSPRGEIIDDFNEDGVPDVVVINGSNFPTGAPTGLSILLGVGDREGTLEPQVQFATGDQPSGFSSGDFNGDGHRDLAVLASGPSGLGRGCFIHLGDGDGNFDSPLQITAAGSGIATGDINLDGHDDLVLSVGFSTFPPLLVFLGNGDATFGAPIRSGSQSNPSRVFLRDLNNDGFLDAVTINFGSGVTVFLGLGDGTFAARGQYGEGLTTDVDLADQDGDGFADMTLAHRRFSFSGIDQGGAEFLRGVGDMRFSQQSIVTLGREPAAIAVADLDLDGRFDLATQHTFASTVVYGSRQRRLHVETRSPSIAGDADLVAVGDVTGDRIPDLVATSSNGNRLVVLETLGGTGLVITEQIQLSFRPVALAATDLDKDGDVDVLLLNQSQDLVEVWKSDDAGLALSGQYAVIDSPVSMVIDDFDGDGRRDLATSNSSDAEVAVVSGLPDGAFGDPQLSQSNDRLSLLASGDFNDDGIRDLVGSSGGSSGRVVILPGLGDGLFGNPILQFVSLDSGDSITALAVADIDEDGLDDLVLAGRGGTFQPGFFATLAGNGDNSFAAADFVRTVSGPGPIAIAVRQLDADTHLDVVARTQSTVVVATGTETGTLAEPASYVFGPGGFERGFVAEDFNGDGSVDVVVSNHAGGISILPNLKPRRPQVPRSEGAGSRFFLTDVPPTFNPPTMSDCTRCALLPIVGPVSELRSSPLLGTCF